MKLSYLKYHRDKEYVENENLFRNIFQKRFYILKRFVNKGRVLDIGCSNGVFLDLFKENGFETWGVEPSKNGLIAKARGHNVIASYFDKATLPKNYFDVVVSNHTLEHVNNPGLFLKKVNQILKSNGIVFVDVPNAGGLGSKLMGKNWPYLLPKEHVSQFNRKSLTNVFIQAGFKILYFETRSGIFEYQNPVLELWQSLISFKKRFFTNILFYPYSLIATILNMGDSMTLVGKKL